MSKEPERLIHGKEFHKQVQADWKKSLEEGVEVEKTLTDKNERQHRTDIHANDDDNLYGIGEIKCSDWDRMTPKAVRRNAQRYARQVYRYVNLRLELGGDVSLGIIFPHLPKTKERLRMVESIFEDEWNIPVVWYDESMEECKARKKAEEEERLRLNQNDCS